MAEDRNIDVLDYFLIIIKWKKLLLILFLTCLVLSYFSIYLFVEEQYDSSATIIPSEQDQTAGLSSIMKSFSGLPLNIGGLNKSNTMDIYNTIIYSRTNIEKVIDRFNLMEDYNIDSREKTIKALKKNIKTEETDDNAYEITVRSNSPTKAAAITNFIISELNNTIVDLNIKKSKDNREFLEQRYNEIKENLRIAEDSLKNFQEKSGIYLAEDQAKASIESYAKLESELATKQVELSVLEKIYGKDLPQVQMAKIAVEEFESKLELIKAGKSNSDFLISMQNIPSKGLEYFRLFRNVEIFNKMLEFIIPLYEQARFEEQKEIPILQVIDYGVPPEKKSYPPRTMFSILISLIVLLVAIIYLSLKNNKNLLNSDKIRYIKKNIISWRT